MHAFELIFFQSSKSLAPNADLALAPLCHGTTCPGHSSVRYSHIPTYTKHHGGKIF